MIEFRGKKFKSIRQASIKLGMSYRMTWSEYHKLKPNQKLPNKTAEILRKWK